MTGSAGRAGRFRECGFSRQRKGRGPGEGWRGIGPGPEAGRISVESFFDYFLVLFLPMFFEGFGEDSGSILEEFSS